MEELKAWHYSVTPLLLLKEKEMEDEVYAMPRYFNIAAAPSFPSCTASTTSFPPFTASPPANTPLIFVEQLSSITNFPFLFSSLFFLIIFSKGTCPAAFITISTSSLKVSPVSTGERRPLASGSPNFILLQISCFTFPQEPFTLTGAASHIILQPSCLAIFNSNSVQGISSCVLR